MSFDKIIDTFSQMFVAYWEYLIPYIQTPTWTNYFYWVIFWFFVCFILELVLPKKIEYPTVKRKGFFLDLFYVFFNDFLFAALGFFALTVVVEMLYKNTLTQFGFNADAKLFNIAEWHFTFQILVLFIIQDFLEYFAHYLLHRIDFLWKFHKIHHAQEQLGAASTRHFHFMEYFVFKPVLYIPFSIIGYQADQYVMFGLVIGVFSSFFTHSNIGINFGFFNYIINNPTTHFWHHAKNFPEKFRHGVNYASVLNIWDVIFKSYYNPKNEKIILGVNDKKVPKGFAGQMIYPFKEVSLKVFNLFKRKKLDA